MFQSMSRILQLEPASKPQNFQAEPQRLKEATSRSMYTVFRKKTLPFFYIAGENVQISTKFLGNV